MVAKSDKGTTDNTETVSAEAETKKSTKAKSKASAKDTGKKSTKAKAKKKTAAKPSAKAKTKPTAKSGTKAKTKASQKASDKTKAKAKTKSTAKSSAKVKAKAPAKKKAASTKSKLKKKKQNLLRIYAEMNKLCYDAVDREVLKRFKIIIDTSEEDITKISANQILKDPKNISISSFHENIQPYIKHYLFLQKRENKKK